MTASVFSGEGLMRFSVLGPMEIVGSGGVLARLAPRERIVLAGLLVDVGRIAPMGRLIDAVWDEDPPPTARRQVQICVSNLRRQLADVGFGGQIVSRPPGYALELADGECVDLQLFDSLSQAGRESAEKQRLEEARDTFKKALSLWRGDAFASESSTAIAAAAARLNERRLDVARQYADVCLALPTQGDLIGDLRALLDEHPLHEGLYSRLILALCAAGRPADALECYRTARATLVAQLGLEPSEELQRLEMAILNGQLPAARTLPGAVGEVSATAAAPIIVVVGEDSLIEHLHRLLGQYEDATSTGFKAVVVQDWGYLVGEAVEAQMAQELSRLESIATSRPSSRSSVMPGLADVAAEQTHHRRRRRMDKV